MDFIPPQLLFVIASAIILIGALLSRIISDSRAVSQTNKLNRRLIKVGRSRLRASFTIIIELSKKADSILPLLERLADQNYKKLDIIVLVKHTSGKNARPTLKRFQESHPNLTVRLVSHKLGMTDLDVIRGYARKTFVMKLSADHKLSANFFTRVSLEEALAHPDIVIPKQYAPLATTITSAILSDAASKAKEKANAVDSSLENGIVYRRSAVLRKNPIVPSVLYAENAYIVTPLTKSTSLLPTLSWWKIVAFVIAVTALVYTLLILRGQERILLIALVLAVYVLMYATRLLGNKAYSLLDKVSLILLSPLFAISRIVFHGIAIVRGFKAFLPRKKHA